MIFFIFLFGSEAQRWDKNSMILGVNGLYIFIYILIYFIIYIFQIITCTKWRLQLLLVFFNSKIWWKIWNTSIKDLFIHFYCKIFYLKKTHAIHIFHFLFNSFLFNSCYFKLKMLLLQFCFCYQYHHIASNYTIRSNYINNIYQNTL